MPPIFPFTAIVGQERMKRALILNAVDTRIGGVLIRGERGTAKSTAARALAALLPKVNVVDDCRFGCDPNMPNTWCTECKERFADNKKIPMHTRTTSFVNLPVSATEDRVVGTLDIEKAIQKGERHFEPGILAGANRGLLYIDEVNLLDDHVVDVLLDSAAMGVNMVEREGISFTHPARFILVGTMNPEEESSGLNCLIASPSPSISSASAMRVNVSALWNAISASNRMRITSEIRSCRKKKNSHTRSSADANSWIK